MENAMVRPRYTRRPVQNRHRRKAPVTGGDLRRIILRQFVICILLLVIVCIGKSINFSATNFVTDKVKYVISYNVELKSVFAYMEKLALEIRNSISPQSADKPADMNNQTSNAPLTSSTAQTSSTSHTSSTAQTSSKSQTSDTDQSQILAQVSSAEQAGNTATLSSTESPQNDEIVQNKADKTMEASSSIENDKDQDTDTDADITTMAETSVLAASSGTAGENPAEMILPVDGTLISQFGEKSGEMADTGKTHEGIDIDANRGVAIRAVLDGKVTETGSSPAYGAYIRIMHADGLQTIYANCSGIIAKKGDIVKKGDIIAEIGGTSAPVGVHLHFEVWKDGTAVDPLEYISVSVR